MQWMKRNFRWMSCREMSKVGSGSWEKPPGFGDRLRLAAHMVICAPCRVLKSNMEMLRKAIRFHTKQLEDGQGMTGKVELSAEKKEAIKRRLREN